MPQDRKLKPDASTYAALANRNPLAELASLINAEKMPSEADTAAGLPINILDPRTGGAKRLPAQAVEGRRGAMAGPVEGVLSEIGLGTPMQAATSIALSPSAVTRFLKPNAAGKMVPNIAERQMMSNRHLAELQATLSNIGVPDDEAQHILGWAQKYPRVTSHASVHTGEYSPRAAATMIGSPDGSSDIWLRPSMTLSDKPNDPFGPLNTYLHEITHTAQNISRKEKFNPEYNAASATMSRDRARWENPFELGASYAADRRAGPYGPAGDRKFVRQNDKSTPPLNAVEALRRLGIIK